MHDKTKCKYRHHYGHDRKSHEVATLLEKAVGSSETASERVDYREEVDGSMQKQEDDEESAAYGLNEFLSDGRVENKHLF